MQATWLLLGSTILLAALGALEWALHRRHLARLRIRIHVNGTRGKSSVTRLIAGGMREAGIVTCAKTTGTLARMILPDGTEYPVFRPAAPNVIEQVRIVRVASECDAEALVVECMALMPSLQWLSEARLVRATHGVITNARADHLDVMGPEEDDVARALAGTTPVRGKLFTAERRHRASLEAVARDRDTELVAVTEEEVAEVTGEELSRFSYDEHAENVALALRVCADLGIARDVALRGMQRAAPDPGAMTTHELSYFGRHIVFVNGFAANDPESTRSVWERARRRHPDVAKRIAIFNCRADRPERSRQLGQACVEWPAADHYVLIGTGTYLFARAAGQAGLETTRLVMAEDRSVVDIFETIVDLAGPSALVMGMGNIGGQGLEIVRHFRNRSLVRTEGPR